MSGNIWVFAEQWRAQISEITYELLALGRELADGLGVPLEVVLQGHQVKDLAQALGAADNVLCVDHAALDRPAAEISSQALAQLVEQKKPRSLLLPLTNVSWDMLGLLPARLKAPFVNFCSDVRVADGNLQACSLLFGGKMEASVELPAESTLLGILPGARPASKIMAEQTPPLEEVAVTLAEAPAVQFKRYLEPEASDVDITHQEVLVAVGRGIQSEGNLAVAEELAEALGGATCGSRPVIDQGWLPLSRQVGKSGLTVKPKLYLAAGISGAPEHVEGMKDSELIIAINTDSDAPIFNMAHYGIVEDAVDMLEALTESVGAAKG